MTYARTTRRLALAALTTLAVACGDVPTEPDGSVGGDRSAVDPARVESPVRVLVYGERTAARSALAGELAALGADVLSRPDLPSDVGPFATVWWVPACGEDFGFFDQFALAGHLASGGGLHVSGENASTADCARHDGRLQDWLNGDGGLPEVVAGGGLVLGTPGLVPGVDEIDAGGDVLEVHLFDDGAVGDVAVDPNTLTHLVTQDAGGIGGLDAADVLAAGEAGTPVAAAWGGESLNPDFFGDDLTAGRLTLIMDVNWAEWLEAGETNDNRPAIENLQAFLLGPEGGEPPNRPPVADAGGDVTVECASPDGASVTLDGSGSSDPDGDELDHEWLDPDGEVIAAGETAGVTLPVGTHTVTLRVTDEDGASDTDEVVVTVEDTTPPVLSFAVEPDRLWPPNHRHVAVELQASVDDACDPSPAVSVLVGSSEPDDARGRGDGATTGDIRVTRADGTVALSSAANPTVRLDPLAGDRLELRAERQGRGDGRVYTLTATARDAAGNAAGATAEVAVGHDRGRHRPRGRAVRQ